MDPIITTPSRDAISSLASSPCARISRPAPSFIRPLRTSISSTTQPLDGLEAKFKGVRTIHPTRPTACIRPASLVYRAPITLRGGASRLLRHILRASSHAPPPQKSEYLAYSPVKFLSLPSKKIDYPHKYLNRSDEILGSFLLNNGGYLDDSDSELEDDADSTDRKPSPNQPVH